MRLPAFAVGALVLLPACQHREPPEAARARATEAFLGTQIADLQKLVSKAESGQLSSQDRIAIGLSEETAKALIGASLPPEQVIGGRIRLTFESVQPIFRGNNAALLFQATAHGVRVPSATARLELGGGLTNFRIEKGTLTSTVHLSHFKVLDTSLGEMAGDVLEALVRDNLAALGERIPALEIPVHLEQSIAIAGLDAGVVVTKPGVLPLEMTLAEVLPVGERLWVLLEVKAGPWQKAAAAEKSP